jgi:hypothetical protein
MTCPLCGQRKARRACPGVGQQICAVCCGTKRLVEIRCPETCVYLASARQHPPAVVQRQQQRDAAALAAALGALTERQQQLVFLLLGVVGRQHGDPLRRVLDEDVAEAAGAMAGTYETAARGVIYEHPAQSLPAQRLMTEWKALLEDLSQHSSPRLVEREAPAAFRSIEQGARQARQLLGDSETAYLDLVGRLLAPVSGGTPPEPGRPEAEERPSGLILPPG